MTAESGLNVPTDLSFEAAIERSQALLNQMAQRELAAAEIERAIAALVASENGARGFFVIYLSDDRAVADQPTDSVVAALKTAPEVVSSLLVKNLAMSTGMTIAHRRNQNQELAQGSDRVQQRSIQLIQQLRLPALTTEANALIESIDTGSGAYQSFLTRWGYDDEQRQTMRDVLTQSFSQF